MKKTLTVLSALFCSPLLFAQDGATKQESWPKFLILKEAQDPQVTEKQTIQLQLQSGVRVNFKLDTAWQAPFPGQPVFIKDKTLAAVSIQELLSTVESLSSESAIVFTKWPPGMPNPGDDGRTFIAELGKNKGKILFKMSYLQLSANAESDAKTLAEGKKLLKEIFESMQVIVPIQPGTIPGTGIPSQIPNGGLPRAIPESETKPKKDGETESTTEEVKSSETKEVPKKEEDTTPTSKPNQEGNSEAKGEKKESEKEGEVVKKNG